MTESTDDESRLDGSLRRDDGNRGRRAGKGRGYLPLSAAGAAMVLWVIATGCNRWPLGELNWIPLIVSWAVLAVGLLLAAAGAWWAFLARRTFLRGTMAMAVSLLAIGGAAFIERKVVNCRGWHWMPEYLTRVRQFPSPGKPVDLCFLFLDHYEPDYGKAGTARQLQRVEAWPKAYENAIAGHVDSDGRPPQHTWFCPVSQFAPGVIERVAAWPRMGWGEIEYHRHHPPTWSSEELRKGIASDMAILKAQGAVTHGYAFIHGNFALAASNRRFCSVVDELDVLRETGCFADFTFPALSSPSQPSLVNTIFYAKTTGTPKPYDTGRPVEVGGAADGLMLVQGPSWVGLRGKIIDDTDMSLATPPDPARIARWVAASIHVKGRPNWVFVNIHSHSAREDVRDSVFSGQMQSVWAELEQRYKRQGFRLHYMTAREAYNVIKAAEAGMDGNPADYRDYLVPPPDNRRPGGGASLTADRAPATSAAARPEQGKPAH